MGSHSPDFPERAYTSHWGAAGSFRLEARYSKTFQLSGGPSVPRPTTMGARVGMPPHWGVTQAPWNHSDGVASLDNPEYATSGGCGMPKVPMPTLG